MAASDFSCDFFRILTSGFEQWGDMNSLIETSPHCPVQGEISTVIVGALGCYRTVWGEKTFVRNFFQQGVPFATLFHLQLQNWDGQRRFLFQPNHSKWQSSTQNKTFFAFEIYGQKRMGNLLLGPTLLPTLFHLYILPCNGVRYQKKSCWTISANFVTHLIYILQDDE